MDSSKSRYIAHEILRGMKAAVPIVLGFIPVGIAFAIMAKSAGLNIIQTIIMSVCVFAGASEMAAVEMYKIGALMIAIVFTVFIMNLRHVIMSICVFRKTEKLGVIQKLLVGFFVTDESFAVITSEKEKCSVWFVVSLGITHYLAWVAGTAIGAFSAELLPSSVSVSLGISLYAMFLGILVPKLKGNIKLFLLVICTAVLNCVLSMFLDGAQSLIISTLAGAFAGVFFVDLDDEKNADDLTRNLENAEKSAHGGDGK